jgi:uncharacterized membrane protein
MGTERGMDRLIFFTDAVTAIAITLLILPLVDLVPAFAAGNHCNNANFLPTFLQDNRGQIFAFVLSFAIIARLWVANHGILKYVQRPTRSLIWLNIAWAFTIVLLPLPTEITAAFNTTPLVVGLYIGTMTVNSVVLTAICLVVYRHPEIEASGDTERLMRLYASAVTSGAFVVAFVVGVTFPVINYWAFFALVLTTPVDWIVRPRIRRREAATNAASAASTSS